jgi:four helix bundle suffix protein
MFGGTGGYFRLDSWILANIVQLATQDFCQKFLNRRNDPCGRQYDNKLNHQMEKQGDSFREEGGFREQLTTLRVESRAVQEQAPNCPDCGKPMTRRKARTGKNAGNPFWGCTAYPDCKGTLPANEKEDQHE